MIIYTNKIINNNGIIESNGINGGKKWLHGGASGGGSVNVFYNSSENDIVPTAEGGKGNGGGNGGNGSVSVGKIEDGTYINVYKNY